MNYMACALTGVQGERVALCDVLVSAVLHDLFSEVTISQTYRNDERTNIEAVYTFPLPLDAVLLELQVEIGGRVLHGIVVEKKAAEEGYEDTVAAGDAAVMLEVIEPGLYTMNVGNLLPQEKATITFSYAILYRWTGERLRFFFPTTIAPRFGESPHQPHQAPEPSLTVENRFSLRVEIFGSLRDAQFVCPSHQVTLAKSADKVVLTLQQAKAVMDRDFILNVKAPQARRSFVLCGADDVGVAAVASFQPFFPGLQQPRALKLAIVIDCSGSMQGDSMAQAKRALQGILDALQPHDRVTLIGFGSSTKVLSDRVLPCNQTNLGKARRFAKELDANMGGTEIRNALHTAYAAVGDADSADIFLVTDGEVSSWEEIVEEAKRAGHRIFTVGVGSAVSEAFVRELAVGTGGECEIVSPGEGMADRVIRHFERMRAPRAKRVAIQWPEGAFDVAPSNLGAVFEGDTVISCARFDHGPVAGSVVLEVETQEGDIVRQDLPIEMAPLPGSTDRLSAVARLAAALRLKEMDDVAGLETALRYRLVSPWTNWLVVATRPEGEKAQGLPALRKVPQTLAAGWGGMGTVAARLHMDACMAPAPSESRRRAYLEEVGEFGLPAATALPWPMRAELPEPFRRLLDLIEDDPRRLDAAHAFDLLEEAGLLPELNPLLRHAADLGLNRNAIAAIILAGILGGPLGEYLSTRTQTELASLQGYARQVTGALRDVGRRGYALTRVLRGTVAHEVFQPGQADAVEAMVERFAGLPDLLEDVEDAIRRSAERIQQHRTAQAQREGGALA